MHERSSGRAFPAIAFSVRGHLYALEQRGTANLLPWLQRYAPPSGAPGLPAWCLGLLNVRGTVQMVADLGHLLGHDPIEPAEDSRLIFIEHGAAQLGLLVDSEIGVRYLRPAASEADGPFAAGEADGPFAAGPALLENQAITVLDGAAIIRHIAELLRAPAYLT